MKSIKQANSRPRGRPAGSTSESKLVPHTETIKHYLAIGLSKRKAAKNLGVGYNTLDRFIKRYGATLGIAVEDGDTPGDDDGAGEENSNNNTR